MMIARASAANGISRFRFRLRWACHLAVLVVSLFSMPGRSQAFITFTPSSGFIEDVVASGLPFATGIAFAPDGRMFIALKSGVVRVYQNGALLPTPFIDISAQTSNVQDRGLLGITLHPDFPNTPYVYLLFPWNPPGYATTAYGGRVSRLIRVEADPAQGYNVALPGSTQPQTVVGGPGHVILIGTNSTAANIGNLTSGRDLARPSCMTNFSMVGPPIEDCIPSDEDSHTIGTVLFGSDGSLFAGAGDGSTYASVDPRALRSQNVDSLAGKIMRIDPVTGLGLPDNPFYDPLCPQCNRSKVYAMGLRNPFRFTVHPLTSEPYIGDVGWDTWEEINTGKGANFGWPCYEGGAAGSPAPVESGTTTSRQQGSYATNAATSAQCQALYQLGLGAVRAPIFSYNHAGTDGAGGTGGASANGGTFYAGSVYPAVYQNALFILDYSRRWIRYLTFDAQNKATVHSFGKESANGMVQVLTGPDSNLYVVVLSPTGSEIRRIRYIAGGNTPPTAVANATPTVGAVPLNVAFSSVGSFDPDAQPLSYGWAFGDGGTSTAPNPTHLYGTTGVYTATLTVTELTTPFAPRSANVLITVGHEPPLATITQPADGTHYNIGAVIPYAGSGESGGQAVDPSQLTWNLRLHHNEHLHFSALPGTPNDLTKESTGSLSIIEHGDNTYYELCLTVTIPPNVTDTRCVTLLPNTTPITLTTTPPGLLINYEDEGLTQASPFLINPVVGSSQTTSLPLIQGGVTFDRWSDGVLSNSHPFVVGTTPITYTAQHLNQLPVAVASATPLSGNAPLTVVFNGSGSSDPEFATLTHSWNFGDGTAVSTQANPVHEYASPGTYQALLTVTDQRGGSSSQTQAIVVSPVSPLCGNGVVNAGEACDGGGCCTTGCQIAPAATVCRAATGTCDVAESCSGAAASCPADAFAAEETTCSVGAVCHSGVCEAATSPPVTAWPDTTVPGFTAAGDASVELGVKFRSDVAGYVTSIRFYKFAANTGTHVGNLWSSTGTPLATATFTNETASGWQRVDFSQPVAIDANTTYVASYHCPNGFYAFGFGYFATQGVDVPPLHLLANDVPGGNGVFHYAATSTFPANTYNASNYWVDVVFSAATVAACSDTLDQDGDGFAGFPQDPGCATAADIDERSPALRCDNGIDDDGDGYVDFGVPAGSGLLPDPGCRKPSSTLENPQCQDGLDNDQMSGIDFDGGASLHGGVPISTADPQCATAYGNSEQASSSCGLGTELAFVLPLLGALSRRMRKLAS